MRRLKSALWLFAWTVWAWLGFGLYRELPRDLGSVVSRLALSEEEKFLGWLPGESIAVAVEEKPDEEPCVVRTYDALTGNVRSKFDGPIRRPMEWDYLPCLRHSVLICKERPEIPGRPKSKSGSALNLKTGEWIDLPCGPEGVGGFAPLKPYAIAARPRKGDSPPIVDGRPEPPIPELDDWRVLVIDLRDGSIVLKITPNVGGQPPRDLGNETFFLDDDSIAIQTSLNLADDQQASPEDDRVEVWRFDSPNKPVHVIKGLKVGDGPSVSETRRVAWHVIGDVPAHADVFDFNELRFILSEPPKDQRKTLPGGTSGVWPGPEIAADGRTVYVPMAKTLWDIDRKTALWKARPNEMLSVLDLGREVSIFEDWTSLSPSVLPKVETFAVRDMSSLQLRYRMRVSTSPRYESVNESREWHLDDENNVYRLSPRVNYPLLALCQTILALPLILLWVDLRWRRNRRLRLASVTP